MSVSSSCHYVQQKFTRLPVFVYRKRQVSCEEKMGTAMHT